MYAPIWAFTGAEGSGKTANMTFWAARHIALGGVMQTFPGYNIHSPHKPEKLLSSPLDVKEWLTMPRDYQDLMMGIDEAPNFLDSYSSGAAFAKVTYRVFAQRRKLNMCIVYTAQNWAWMHPRIRWLTHLYTICSDLHHTRWGKSEGLGRGTEILITNYDSKGFFTGHPWQLLSRKIINIKSVWYMFQSFDAIDPFAGETKWDIKRHHETIDRRTAEEIARASQFHRGMVAGGIPDLGYSDSRENESYMRQEEAVAEGMEQNDRIFNKGDLGLLERAAQAGMKPRDLSKMQSALMKEKRNGS